MSEQTNLFQVTLVETGESFTCMDGESVLHGLARLGKRGIPVGCRGGGCGVCKIQVLEGTYKQKCMSAEHVSTEDAADQRVLACRVFPTTALRVAVVGCMKKAIIKETCEPTRSEDRHAEH
ncbi:2Fe-2S iron-sulfur cluster-binding protein [Eoetvoesiella caeni]